MSPLAGWQTTTGALTPREDVYPDQFSSETKTVLLPAAMEDVLGGKKDVSVTLPQYGVTVLR